LTRAEPPGTSRQRYHRTGSSPAGVHLVDLIRAIPR
jgi:hypothetical protein